jgi:hypothetical protein
MGVNAEAFGDTAPAADLARKLIEGKSRDELLALAGALLRKQTTETSTSEVAGKPETPDELWDYIKETWHVQIPRVAVCEDHDAPFDFVCAGFFDWYPNIFEISSRGAGKSFKRALGHALNARFKPGSESATFGAVEEQAKRVYNAYKTFINPEEIVGEPRISETNYKPIDGMPYGSKVEILGGTVAAVNGPHPQFPHSDEVELMRADTWRESRNLASDKITPDGRRIKGQNSATSTMKWKGGRVWQILEHFKAAKAKAVERYGDNKELVDDMITKTAPFYVFVSCLFENSAQVPNCRLAPENADLLEWEPGLDREACRCDCVLPDTEIAINGELRAGFRRSYDGPVIELVTASGRCLTVTPNHPVLTSRGWIAARLLEKGDHVVSSARCNAATTSNLDQVPPRAEDVFASLLVQAAPGGSDSVAPLGVDFHGDAIFGEGEVEIPNSRARSVAVSPEA